MDNLTSYLSELNAINSRLTELKSGKQINPKIADDLIQIGQHKVRLFLKKLFSTEFSDLIDEDDYSQFILYSYKSYYGDIPAQEFDEKGYKRRLNLFQKGKRWSEDTGKIFYNFLDKINEKFQDTPINLYGELCSKIKKQHLIIKTGMNCLTETNENTITLPSKDLVKNIKVDGVSIAGNFDIYIKNINDIDRRNRIELTLKKFDVAKLVDIALKNEQLKPFVEKIKSFFSIEEDDTTTTQRIVKSFFTYRFNDLPYDLNLFFPNNDGTEFTSTLMIALPRNTSIEDCESDFFVKLVVGLKFLDEYEKEIVIAAREKNDSYIIWKKIYEREYGKFYTFMKSVENICYSVCKQHNISYSHFSGRVKTFEGFYNKLFIRANNEIENKKLQDEQGITYIDAIEEPHMHFHKVFNIIRDLAGVRIVLLFEDDLERVEDIFESLESKEDLIVKERRFYHKSVEDEDDNIPQSDKEDTYNYRSIHITVLPGSNRLKLIEYRNLADIQCEIQFRSILAHAWADVNHDLDYKHREVVKEIIPEKQDALKEEFNKLSKNLYENDKFLNTIKEASKKIDLN